MFRSLLLITILAAHLCACSQGSHDPASQLSTEAKPAIGTGSFELALPEPAPPTIPHTASVATAYLDGFESIAYTSRCTPYGNDLELWAMDDGLEWALYEFPGAPADAVKSIGYVVRDRASMFTEVILALSDYENNRWEFFDPMAKDAHTFLLDAPPGRYTNTMGNTYLLVLAWDQSEFTVQSVNISFSNRESSQGGWHTKGHDNQRTHRSGQLVVENADLMWRNHYAAAFADASPSFSLDGTIYITSYTENAKGKLFSIASDGTTNWTYEGLANITATPAISEAGSVYFGDRARHFYCINQEGERSWIEYPNRDIHCSATINEDLGCVYFIDLDRTLFSYTLQGEQNWGYELEVGPYSTPAMNSAGDLYIGTPQGKLAKVTAQGEITWLTESGQGWTNGSPCITGSNIVYGTMEGYFYAVDDTGQVVNEYSAGGEFHASPALSSTGNVFIGNTDGYLYVFDSSANFIDRFDAGSEIKSSAAIDGDDTVFFGTKEGRLIALNPDLTIQWEFQAIDELRAGPAISDDGTLVVPCLDGTIYAFAPNEPFAPADPTGFTASDGTKLLAVQLTWDEAFDVDGYYVYRDGGSEPVATLGFVNNWLDTGITDTEEHTYNLVAFNAHGESDPVSDTGFAVEAVELAPWSMSRGGPYRTNTSTFAGMITTPQQQETLDYGTGGCSAVAFDAAGNYYLKADHWLYCYAPDGTEQWKYDIEDYDDLHPVLGANNSIIVPGNGGILESISSAGIHEWFFEPDGIDSLFATVVSPDGTIIALGYGSIGEFTFAVNPDGTEKWRYESNQDSDYIEAAAGSDGTIYIPNYEDRLIALNSDGSLRWEIVGDSYYGIPVIYADPVNGDRLILGGGEGMVCLDADKNELWEVAVSGYKSVTPDGIIYVTGTHRVYKYDIDGNYYDEVIVDGFQFSRATVNDINNNIYVMETTGNVHCLDSSLTELWTFQSSCYYYDTELAISPDGRLFLQDSHGEVYILSDPTG